MTSVDTRAPTIFDRLIGRNIQARREERGRSQVDLARALGVHVDKVQGFERGEGAFSLDVLTQIADALDVAVISFFGGARLADDPSDLSARAIAMAATFDRLDDEGKDAVEALIRRLPGNLAS